MIKENIIETPTPSSGTELDERDASVEEAPVEQAPVEQAPVEQAPVEEASSSTQESSSEVGAADAAEGLLAKLEEELKEKEGLEALFDNLEARVSGDVAENVAPFDEATPGQGTPDQRNSGQGNSGQGNSDQEAADQEASGEGKKEEKPKKSVIEATKDYFIASAGALFDFLIEMLAAIKKFILQGNEGKTQAKTGSDFKSNDSKEETSRGKNVSPPQISSAQEAESPLKSDEGNTSNVPGDLKSEETQSESDKPKGSLQDRLSNLIASCIHDPEKMKTVKEFLEKGTEGLGGEELENFDKFKKIVNDEIDKQKGAETNQPAKENDVENFLEEGEVEESLKESEVKESSEKSEVKESSEESENINSLNQVFEDLGGEASQENETSKKEFKDIPELDEVKRNLASGGAMRSDEGNSSSAPAPAVILAPAVSKGDNGR